MRLATVGLIAAAAVAALGIDAGTLRGAGSTRVENQFVAAANRGDFATVCRLYSRRYLKASQESCRALYRSRATIFGPFDYRIVRRRTLAGGRRHVDLTVHHHHSFIELAHERVGWRIVGGGF